MNCSEQRAENSEQRATRAVICSLLALLCALPSAHAISDNAGTRAGSFLNIGTDARGVALGDAMVSMARGTDALRWNAGALGVVDSREASATHIQYYQDVHIENIGAVYPIEEGGVGANLFYLSPGTLDGRDTSGTATGNFKFYDTAGTLGYGRKMLTRAEGVDLSLGLAVKVVEEKIADQSFQNSALDIGVLSSPLNNLNLGLSIRNLSTHNANFAREVVGGASYRMYNVFTGAFALNYSNDSPVRVSIAGEYALPEYESSVRLGYQTHDTLQSSQDSQIKALQSSGIAGLTMGAGFGYKVPLWPNIKFDLDYAMAPFGALGISHTVTVKTRW